MLRFEGVRQFSLPVQELYPRLSDTRFLVECIPDVERVRELDEEHASLVLRPAVAFVTGTLDVTIRLVERVAPASIRVLLGSKGIGNSSEVEANLTLASSESGSTVHWAAEVKNLGGLLKLVPGGLIRGAAEKVINHVWDQMTRKLQPSPPT